MKRLFLGTYLFFGLFAIGVSLGAKCWAAPSPQPRLCGKYKKCDVLLGGGIPIPFGANRTAELADGEKYALVGKVVSDQSVTWSTPTQPWLKVELSEHPWLASKIRKASPFYPISQTGAGGLIDWYKLESDGNMIVLYATAHQMVRMGISGAPESFIELEVTKLTVVPDASTNRRDRSSRARADATFRQ